MAVIEQERLRRLHPDLRELLARVCTPDQLELLALYEPGVVGFRQVGEMLGITMEAARDRYRRAVKNVRREATPELRRLFRASFEQGRPDGTRRRRALDASLGELGHGDRMHLGYVLTFAPDHPFSSNGYVRRSRLVVEWHLRRTDPASPALIRLGEQLYLRPEMVVHHVDENKVNNAAANLVPLTPSEHQRLHEDTRRRQA